MRQAVLLIVLFASGTGPVFPQAGKTGTPSFEIDKGNVIRRDAGQVRWATRLGPALDDPQPSHLAWDAKRVYVRHRDGVTALSTATGTILWHSQGPNDRLLVSRDRLLATEEAGGQEPLGHCPHGYHRGGGLQVPPARGGGCRPAPRRRPAARDREGGRAGPPG
jgi:hypothetical protein